MNRLITLILVVMITAGCNSVFVEPAFTERQYFDSDLSWAMNQAYNEEYGFKGLCERRSLYAQNLVPDSYIVTMTMKRDKRIVGKLDHAILCKDKMCVDSTGVIADRYTTFPESDLVYHAYDIKPI